MNDGARFRINFNRLIFRLSSQDSEVEFDQCITHCTQDFALTVVKRSPILDTTPSTFLLFAFNHVFKGTKAEMAARRFDLKWFGLASLLVLVGIASAQSVQLADNP